MVTPFISQIALDFGCDDVEGTVVYERVYHDAGAHTPMMLSYGGIVRMIKATGKEPVERDSFYNTVRAFEPDDPIFDSTMDAVPGTGAGPELVELVGTGRA
jgi:aminodeoxyfutalosine synthase